MNEDIRSQAGFSLTELLVAMLVTMIVSGAVFGLMTAGQGAFRREPELTERQQNIRVAMDLIQRDIATAGVGMEPFEQVFTRGDGVNEAAPFLNGVGPMGPNGVASDRLQILGNDGECPDVPVLDSPGSNLLGTVGIPSCYQESTFVLIVFPDGTTRWGFAHNLHSNDNRMADFPPGQQPPKSEINNPNDLDPVPTRITPMQLIRYEIANEPDGVPGLWRTTIGGIDPADGDYKGAPNPLGGWQLVARGIEDLQVQYLRTDNVLVDQAPLMVVNDWPALVREVQVTLWARSNAPNLQGQRVSAIGNFVRASLNGATTPRQVLLTLRGAPAPWTWQ